jgi:predicted GTPase
MSQIDENFASTLKEDDSLWKKLKNFWENDYSKTIDDIEDQDKKVLRIAVIGKTRVGKGRFINAIRAIKKSKEIGEKGPDEFEIQGPSANVTHGMKPGPLIIEKYGYPDNKNPIIYFYDTGGFGDAFNENYNLEEELKKYQKENKIKFDAIAFIVASNNFVKEDIKPLKDQENKVCLVFYIANKVDILKSEIGDEKKFQEEKGKIKGNILELLKKNEVNKHDFSTNNTVATCIN